MNDLQEKLDMIRSIFSQINLEDAGPEESVIPTLVPLQHAKYYGGTYNNHKYLYSELMIKTLPIDKLEQLIKKQIGIL